MAGVVVLVAGGAAVEVVEVVAAAAVEVGGLLEPVGGRVRVLDPLLALRKWGTVVVRIRSILNRVIECSSEVSRTSMVFSATPS
jgi:hypothetical protein